MIIKWKIILIWEYAKFIQILKDNKYFFNNLKYK